jgi:hypothetical protein
MRLLQVFHHRDDQVADACWSAIRRSGVVSCAPWPGEGRPGKDAPGRPLEQSGHGADRLGAMRGHHVSVRVGWRSSICCTA